ncbi:MAG TPA: GNAT family N-acetyltransferase [Jatrophihabitantaceae bacterium]|jgi:GNAT superfamily N-acetyltransferase
MTTTQTLPGQDTLLACWSALARISPGRLRTVSGATAAVFPESAYLNNAILTDSDDADTTAVRLAALYADGGVTSWAAWIPSPAADFAAADRRTAITGLTRDITTLVMHADLPDRLPRHPDVVRASIADVERLEAGEPIPASRLGPPDRVPGLNSWVLLHDGTAAAAAYTYRHGPDCGVYAVGTRPERRRRGLARALLQHALADAHEHGARTASLQSTPMGQALYESLGFRAGGRYEEWVNRSLTSQADLRLEDLRR